MSASKPSSLPFSQLSDDQVREELTRHHIGLTVEEARKITTFLGRDPTLVEAIIWGIQGSEHSSYKSSRRFLKAFTTTGKHVILGPREDSGIVAITDDPPGKRWGLVISHESHNHPSQIVPFEGAATGVGGTVRDVVCMGARVIGAMDLLRLGDLQSDESRSIAKEVIRGIGGYGNPLGIPNVGGDTVFDSAFNTNCLVNAIALGIVREDEIIHSYVPEEAGQVGYDIILVGKPTDRSGFGGAAFSSLSLDAQKKEQNTGAVQEPNPFLERHLLASTYALFDWLAEVKKLDQVSFKDLGAGGVVCATVEQVAERNLGADIDLDTVHVALPDLPPEIIACAETQERFCWMCHPSLTSHMLKHYNEDWDLPSVAENARASVIGKVTNTPIYRLKYHAELVCEAKSQDITLGLQYVRPTELKELTHVEPSITCTGDTVSLAVDGREHHFTFTEIFLAMIGHPNYASRSPVIRHYDKTVIGNSVIEAGEGDAGVLQPLKDLESYTLGGPHPGWDLPPAQTRVGVAVAGDGNPRYGRISAYWQGALAVVESMMNVAATGALPRALTDCLNYGNPEKPAQLALLEQGVQGIADAANGIRMEGEAIPVISGNVSLYNATPDGGAIPPSAIVCCVAVIPDAGKAVTMQLKDAGSILYYMGLPKQECGGSAYYEILESMTSAPLDTLLGSRLPKPAWDDVQRLIQCVTQMIDRNLVRACHDVSDGGLLLALFEMLLPQRKQSSNLGIDVTLDAFASDLPTDVLLFTQTPAYLVEVPSHLAADVEATLQSHSVPFAAIGRTTAHPLLTLKRGDTILLQSSFDDLYKVWSGGLSRALHSL